MSLAVYHAPFSTAFFAINPCGTIPVPYPKSDLYIFTGIINGLLG